MRKKIINIFLIVIMMTICLTLTTNINVQALGDNTPTIEIESKTVVKGSTVEVSINVINNPGLAGAKIMLTYDEGLTLIEAKEGEVFSSLDYTAPPSLNSSCYFNWDSEMEQVEEDGTLLKLTFEISTNLKENEELNIMLTYKMGDIYNRDLEDLNFEIKNGKIKVIDYIPGDVNNDGTINGKDVTLIRRYNAGYEGLEINVSAADVNNDGTINGKDVTLIRRHNAGYNVELLPSDSVCSHNITKVIAKEATCTESGNKEYYECTLCKKLYIDEKATKEISLEETIIEVKGHTYNEKYEYDEIYHWNPSSCGHEVVNNKEKHDIDDKGNCSVCGYSYNIKLDTPIINRIEYDTIYWYPVENADYYLVTVNDNYECTLRGTSCSLKNVRWNGEEISDYGYINVTVKALGYDNFIDSQNSEVYNSYFYVPESSKDTEIFKQLTSYRIGYGYNLVEDEYLDITKSSRDEIFNLSKLLTIGSPSITPNTKGYSDTYYFSSIDEYSNQRSETFNASVGISNKLLGSLDFFLSMASNLNYKEYTYNTTYIVEAGNTFKDYDILNMREYLIYCLSDEFLRDLNKQYEKCLISGNFKEFVEYVFNTYGTHAILGITTGGSYVATYTISTNEEDIAKNVKAAFKVAAGSKKGISEVLKLNVGVDIEMGQSNSWKNSTTEACFNVTKVGSSGGLVTSPEGLDSALSNWDNGVTEETAVSVRFTKDGALDISSILRVVFNEDIASLYNDYISEKVDDSYYELYNQYTKNIDEPISELIYDNNTGENVLQIDLSKYQSIGKIDESVDSNLIKGIFTVYPTMLGKDVDKILVIGDFGSNDLTRKLIDKFSLYFPNSWKRNINIVFKNCGFISSAGESPINVSDIRTNIDVNISYEGINVFEFSNGEHNININVGEYTNNIIVNEEDSKYLDFCTMRITNNKVYLPIADKEGYTFLYWLDESGNKISFEDGELIENIDSMHKTKIYAKWGPNVYNIELDANDEKIYLHYGEAFYDDYIGDNKIHKIDIPSKEGYVFGGYYLSVTDNETFDAKGYNLCIDEDGNIKMGNEAFSSDNKIYSLWKPAKYKISLKENVENEDILDEIYIIHKTGIYSDEDAKNEFTKIEIPIKAGYNFAGYRTIDGKLIINSLGELEQTEIENVKKITSNVDLFAWWLEGIYTIELKSNTTENTGTNKIYYKYNMGYYSTSDCLETTKLDKIECPTKTGYVFNGYKDVQGESVINNLGVIEKHMLDSNVELYADWLIEEYTVSFILDGGHMETQSIKVSFYNENYERNNYNILPIPTKEGYAFAGWQWSDYIINNETKVVVAANHALKAIWVANEYKIETFSNDPNIGVVTVNPMKKVYNYGDEVTITANPTAIGKFKNWSNNNSNNTLNITVTEDIKLVAIFEYLLCNVTFIDETGSHTQTVIAGDSAIEPILTNHTFIGWDKDFSCVQEHMIVRAIYLVGETKSIFVADSTGNILNDFLVTGQSFKVTPETDKIILSAEFGVLSASAYWSVPMSSNSGTLYGTVGAKLNIYQNGKLITSGSKFTNSLINVEANKEVTISIDLNVNIPDKPQNALITSLEVDGNLDYTILYKKQIINDPSMELNNTLSNKISVATGDSILETPGQISIIPKSKMIVVNLSVTNLSYHLKLESIMNQGTSGVVYASQVSAKIVIYQNGKLLARATKFTNSWISLDSLDEITITLELNHSEISYDDMSFPVSGGYLGDLEYVIKY